MDVFLQLAITKKILENMSRDIYNNNIQVLTE